MFVNFFLLKFRVYNVNNTCDLTWVIWNIQKLYIFLQEKTMSVGVPIIWLVPRTLHTIRLWI